MAYTNTTANLQPSSCRIFKHNAISGLHQHNKAQAWPGYCGLGLAFDGLGFKNMKPKPWAEFKQSLGLALAWATAFLRILYTIYKYILFVNTVQCMPWPQFIQHMSMPVWQLLQKWWLGCVDCYDFFELFLLFTCNNLMLHEVASCCLLLLLNMQLPCSEHAWTTCSYMCLLHGMYIYIVDL